MEDLPADGPPGLLLDEQLCFALYAASRAITARYRPVLDELGLTYPQYLVMLVLWEEGEVSVGRIGARLHLDSGTLSPLLKRLELAGLVTRRKGRVDERAVHVSPTEAGAALRERACSVPPHIFDALGLDAAELRRLQGTLAGLAAHLAGRPPTQQDADCA